MSQVSLTSYFDGAKSTPTISSKTQALMKTMPEFFDIFSLTCEINSYKKIKALHEEFKKNPVKARVISLLAAGLIVTIFIGGMLGAHHANIGAAIGILVGTVVVANVVGAYFNYRWRGHEPHGDLYGGYFCMSLLGIAVPIWRTFGNNWDQTILEEFKEVRLRYHTKTHKAIMDMLAAQPVSTEIEQAKKEFQAVHDYFSKDNVPIDYIEMDDIQRN